MLMSMVERAFTKAVKKWHFIPAHCLRCLSCLALSSILLNIVNGIINAVAHREMRARWAASGAIDPKGEN